MNHIQRGPKPTPQSVNDNEPSTKFKKANHFSKIAHVSIQTKITRISLRHKQTSSVLRLKPFLALRLAKSKQIVREKASALFCRGRQDFPAKSRYGKSPLISGPKAVAAPRGVLPTSDLAAEQQAVAEDAAHGIDNDASSRKIGIAYSSTSTSTDPDPPLVPDGSHSHIPPVPLSASPAASWTMTPAGKIGLRESVARRRTSFRITYDPSIPLEYSDKGAEGTVDGLGQELQTAEALLSEGQAGSVRDVVCRGSEECALKAHAKPVSSANDSSNAAFITTSSAISLSKLDSDAFDAALKLQANNNSNVPTSTSSVKTLLIPSDAIFLPSAMEAETSSALLSSKSKGTGSTSSQIAQIMHAVKTERDQLAAQNARMLRRLRRAAQEKVEYRGSIARLKQSQVEQERRLMGRIAELQNECDRGGWEVERLRRVVPGEGEAEGKLE